MGWAVTGGSKREGTWSGSHFLCLQLPGGEPASGTRVKQGTRLETTVDVPASDGGGLEQGGGSEYRDGWPGLAEAQGSAFGFTVPFTQSTPGLWVTGLSLALLAFPLPGPLPAPPWT